ncbi:MAG: MiaB/RimO family radical SAM methylthiotransferase [Candidatus Portnoybacteria bacterium]
MRYHIITYGCQMNKSDSERLAAKLEKQKHQPAEDIQSADLVVINVCSVRQSAINRVYSKIKNIREDRKKKIVLTGCILEKDRKQFKELVNQIWPIEEFDQKAECFSKKEVFIPIMTGCDNFCSYCAVPYTRGRERSRPAKEIIKEIENLIKKGCQKIILLGQNVNSYTSTPILGTKSLKFRDLVPKIDFPKLLKMINGIDGNFQIEFMTSHPKDFSDELIKTIAKSDKISKQIHLPVQSGNNQILKKMNRGYTVGQYKNLIKKIRERIPCLAGRQADVKISTDIIVGFPDETEKQFQDTVKLVKELNFSQAYISAYSSRPGTAAAKLKDNIPSDEKKRRKKILLDLIK